MNSISKATEQVKNVFNGHDQTSQFKNRNQGNFRSKNLSNQVDPLEGLLPADKERLREREARIQREIQQVQKQLQTDIDLVKSPKVVNSGRLSNMKAQAKETLVSAKDSLAAAKDRIVKTVNSSDVSKIQSGLKDSIISAKEQIMGDKVKSETAPLKTEKTESSVPSSSALMSNIGDKMKSGLVFAQDTLKSSNITESLQGGFVSAKDTLLSAKDRMFGTTIQPIEGGMPGRNHPNPERFEVQSSGLVSKITDNVQGGFMTVKDNLFAVKDRFMGPNVESVEGGMPGRNHPHPERFEVQAPGLATKIGNIMSANSGLATKINDNLQGGFVFAKDGLSSAKDRIFGTIQPIEGGMPGRNHPHPEQFEVQIPGLMNKISNNLQGGLEFAKGGFVSAKGGLVSAKGRIFGSTIQPIEGGMPGRYHPHPERFEANRGFVTKISENIPTGFISAMNENLQGGFATAKDGLLSAKTKVWGPSIQPIEGGMPGRYHPHPERFEANRGFVTKISENIPTGFISAINDNLQGGFATAKDGLLSAKTKVWGPSIQPIEGGMPGRNHPHPERFEAKTGFVSKISDSIPTGFISTISDLQGSGFVSKLTDNFQGGFVTAKDGLLAAKNKVWGPSIQPIEGGMPGRNHPHPERFEAKNPGIVSKLTDNLQGGFISAKGGLVSAKNKIWGPTIQPIEGGMPGRNHPHAELFKAKDSGIVSKFTNNVQGGLVSAKGGLVFAKNKIWGPTIHPIEGGMPGRNHPNADLFKTKDSGIVSKFTNNIQGGFGSAKSGLVSAKNKIWGPTIQPIEGGMPGRNHPHPERFEAKNPGLVSKLTDNLQGGFVSAKGGLVSAKNKIWGPTIQPIEGGMPGRNHPHAELFKAKDSGIVSKFTNNVQGGLVFAKNKIWGPTIQPIEGGMPGRNHPNADHFKAKDSGIVSKFTDNLQGGFGSAKSGLVSAKNKIWGSTIQPIEGGMPGRNHPNAERFEAKNPGLVSKLTDNLQGGFDSAKGSLVSAKNKIWGSTIQPVEGGMPGRNHPNAARFEAKASDVVEPLEDEEDDTFALQPTEGSRIVKDSNDQVDPIQTETVKKNETQSKLSKLVSESKLAELFDMEPETENEIGIVDQTALEPSSDIVEDNTEQEQSTEVNEKAESPKPLGFFEKLKSLF